MRIILLLCVAALLYSNPVSAGSCTYCHSNETKMAELGYPYFYFTSEEVLNQSKMLRIGLGGPKCEDCHLGNQSSYTTEGAHEGMPRLIAVSKEGLKPVNRTKYLSYLAPRQENLPLKMIPTELKTILYHDRNPETFAFNAAIANETCGKCHPRQFEDFAGSIMAQTKMQKQYPTFTSPKPHNCGYWLVNYEKIAAELAASYSLEQAKLNERVCRQCHTSCLDCHYTPDEGRHAFRRVVPPTTCYFGGGRGICHAGAEEFRRGAGYFREEASFMPSDAHALKNISCTACHRYDDHNISRSATCQDCHTRAEEAVEKSVHKNVSCEACHVNELGGYQLTFWAPGVYWGIETPLAKLNYYGTMSNPILIRDQDGKWIPTKPMPHAVLNMKNELGSRGLEFRNLPERKSRDAYAVAGTVSNLPENNNAILWIHMDKISHGYGKARGCTDCHASNEQRAFSTWAFLGEHVNTTPFYGSHEIVANSSGLYILNLKNDTKIDIQRAIDFAPWLYGLEWSTPGNFAVKKLNEKTCGENGDSARCESCHLAKYANVHEVITPGFMKVKQFFAAAFLIALLGIISIAYRIWKSER